MFDIPSKITDETALNIPTTTVHLKYPLKQSIRLHSFNSLITLLLADTINIDIIAAKKPNKIAVILIMAFNI